MQLGNSNTLSYVCVVGHATDFYVFIRTKGHSPLVDNIAGVSGITEWIKGRKDLYDKLSLLYRKGNKSEWLEMCKKIHAEYLKK